MSHLYNIFKDANPATPPDPWDFKAEILLIRLEKVRFGLFPAGLSIEEPVRVILGAAGSCCQVPFQTTEEEEVLL